MTRKDYILIASVIEGAMHNWEGYTPEANEALIGLARSLAHKLGDYNPNFDRAKFLEACGVK